VVTLFRKHWYLPSAGGGGILFLLLVFVFLWISDGIAEAVRSKEEFTLLMVGYFCVGAMLALVTEVILRYALKRRRPGLFFLVIVPLLPLLLITAASHGRVFTSGVLWPTLSRTAGAASCFLALYLLVRRVSASLYTK
jgi:hypothetical protein